MIEVSFRAPLRRPAGENDELAFLSNELYTLDVIHNTVFVSSLAPPSKKEMARQKVARTVRRDCGFYV
jgi:hypothetical protein